MKPSTIKRHQARLQQEYLQLAKFEGRIAVENCQDICTPLFYSENISKGDAIQILSEILEIISETRAFRMAEFYATPNDHHAFNELHKEMFTARHVIQFVDGALPVVETLYHALNKIANGIRELSWNADRELVVNYQISKN
ncbi:MAG: hypothetical protein KF763_13155 [Cyclobacteriaceae bacterium]|nr:hypothetical protein [Cyclobacteriaceae bacterium]